MILERMAEKIALGKPVFGTSLRFYDPGIVEMMGKDWDFVWIDLQHGTIEVNHLLNIVRSCDLVGVSAIIRLPGIAAPDMVSFVLDMDPAGTIIAQVDTVAQAEAMVRAAKFPPLGDRSWGGRRIIDRNGRQYAKRANKEQLLIVQIESPTGLENCEAIAAVKGVDGLMIGPDDLSLRLGIMESASLFEGELYAASKKITSACHKHGKLAMGFGGKTVDEIRKTVEAGFNLISMGADAIFVQQGSAALRRVREEFK